MRIAGLRRRRPSLRSHKAVALKLTGELPECVRLVAGENERSLDRLQCRAVRQTRARCRVLGNGDLRSSYGSNLRLWRDAFGGRFRLRVNDVLDGSYSADGFLGEYAQLQRECSSQFAFEVDRAAAHAGDHPRMLDLWPLKLHKNDGLARPKKIR